jgi:hypothetical protein
MSTPAHTRQVSLVSPLRLGFRMVREIPHTDFQTPYQHCALVFVLFCVDSYRRFHFRAWPSGLKCLFSVILMIFYAIYIVREWPLQR